MDEAVEAELYPNPALERARTALHLSAPYLGLETLRSRYYLGRLGRRMAPGAMLEIGCGHGTFLLEAARLGWQAIGMERSRHAAAAARERGATVIDGFFPEDLPTGRSYDMIALLDVLEHVVDPLPFLDAVRARLRPGGLLFVQVPNWESLVVQVQGPGSSVICPGHWSYFSAASLGTLMRRAGFSTLETDTVQSEVDRLEEHPPQRIEGVLDALRPGERGTPDASRLYRLGLGYKLIGIFGSDETAFG